MKKDISDIIELEIKKSKRLKLLFVLAIASGFLIYALIFIPFFPASSTNIQGIAVRLTAVQTDEGNFPRMMVMLENDVIVKASMPRKMSFLKGAKVNLLKKKSIIGIQSYRVFSYAKTTHNKAN